MIKSRYVDINIYLSLRNGGRDRARNNDYDGYEGNYKDRD